MMTDEQKKEAIKAATDAINEGRGVLMNFDVMSQTLKGTGYRFHIYTDQETGRGIIEAVEDK